MPFNVTKQDIKKSQKCPAGMHVFTVVAVEDEYLNEKGTTVQKVDFETEEGYCASTWFNDRMLGSIIEFVAAADDIDPTDMDASTINLKAYVDKQVAGSVSHVKNAKDGKINAQIDNYFSTSKVPF